MKLLEELRYLKEAKIPMGDKEIVALIKKLDTEVQKGWKKTSPLQDKWAAVFVETLVLEIYKEYFEELNAGETPDPKKAKKYVEDGIMQWMEGEGVEVGVHEYLDSVDPRKFINKVVKIK